MEDMGLSQPLSCIRTWPQDQDSLWLSSRCPLLPLLELPHFSPLHSLAPAQAAENRVALKSSPCRRLPAFGSLKRHQHKLGDPEFGQGFSFLY